MRSSVRQITLKSLKYKTGDAKPILQSSRVFHFHVTVTAPRMRMFTLRSGLCQGDPLAPKGHRLGAGLGRDPGRLRAWRQLSNSWAGALCALLPPPPRPSSSDSPACDPAWTLLAPGSASAGKPPRAASRPPPPPPCPEPVGMLRLPHSAVPPQAHSVLYLPPVLPSLFLNKGSLSDCCHSALLKS